MLICSSCRRRCDPNRSFCTNCGSSVFIDEREASRFDPQPTPQVSLSSPSVPPSVARRVQSAQRAARTLDQAAERARRAASAARSASAPAAAIGFRLGSLIRLAIFLWLVWYVGGWMLRIPEVLVLKDRVQAGHFSDDDLKAVRDAIGARIQTFLRNAQDPNPPPRVAPPTEKTAEAPARPRPRERGDGVIRPPIEVDKVPPGVSLPGNGVSLPRIVQSVKPVYTLDALRAKGEGTVVLQAVVRTNGVATDIAVVRSLDLGLDERAITAVKQWRFAPGERAGQPVPVLVQIAVPFLLQ